MFDAASPDERGRDLRAAERIDDALRRLDTEFADRPLLEARLRTIMGTTDTPTSTSTTTGTTATRRRRITTTTTRPQTARTTTITTPTDRGAGAGARCGPVVMRHTCSNRPEAGSPVAAVIASA